MKQSPTPATSSENKDERFYSRELEASRERLLDLTLRNKLLNFPPAAPDHRDDGRAHKYVVVQGKLKAVWDRLIEEENNLKIRLFDPAALQAEIKKQKESKKTDRGLIANANGATVTQLEEDLETGKQDSDAGHLWIEKLSPEAFQKRLKRLRDEAKTLEDTTGDSAFFLACGFLKWREPLGRGAAETSDAPQDRFAPLVLVKVSLKEDQRGAPGKRQFKVVPEDAPQDNESLRAKLKKDRDFKLPQLSPEAKIGDYIAQVRRAITQARLEHFEVQDTMALGFFNFARYRLWLDLDSQEWPQNPPQDHEVVRSLLAVEPLDRSGPREINASTDLDLADQIALHQETTDIPLVKDADSTQYAALLHAGQGKSIVIIGPPGSGKSQTITNLIAASIAAGKKVLFAAQKLPALDVVAARIAEAGLGDFCLRFYSHIGEAANERRPVTPVEIHRQLSAARDSLSVPSRATTAESRAPGLAKRLNKNVQALHTEHSVYGETLQHILCSAAKLREDAEAVWGDAWSETLLILNLPKDSEITSKWKDARTGLLTEMARLRHEAGDFWHGWRPLRFSSLDLPVIELAFGSHRRALRNLFDWCVVIDTALCHWDRERLEGLLTSVGSLTAPSDVQDQFLRSLCSSAEELRLAHELEREFTNAENSLTTAQSVLSLLPEGVASTATFVFEHLKILDRLLPPQARYGDAAKALEEFGELIRTTDRLLELLAQHPDGITAFKPETDKLPSLSLITSLACQSEGRYPRAPKAFLPALARLLQSDPTVAEEGMIIADKLDVLASAQSETHRTFKHVMRAEKEASEAAILDLQVVELSGLGAISVSLTQTAEKSCLSLVDTSVAILQSDSSLLAVIHAGEPLNEGHVRALARVTTITIDDLCVPKGCSVRLVRAWAEARIAESEARDAAQAHELSVSLQLKITGLIAGAFPNVATMSTLARAVEAAESWGHPDSPFTTLTDIACRFDNLERASRDLWSMLARHVCGFGAETFGDLLNAVRLQAVIAIPPSRLSSCNPTTFSNPDGIRNLRQTATTMREERMALLAAGASKLLGDARDKLNDYVRAIGEFEKIIQPLVGLNRANTMRELRAIGKAVGLLRSMPPLPLGCDAVKAVGTQQSATLLWLAEHSDSLTRRIGALPLGCNYSMMPDAATARRQLADIRERQGSLIRIFSGPWKQGRATLKRFAPSLSGTDCEAAFETACMIKAEEEEFARNPSGVEVVGSYFQGLKTDFGPLLIFARWAQDFGRSLEGVYRPEGVLIEWSRSSAPLATLARISEQLEVAIENCQGYLNGFHGAFASCFSPDTPIEEAKPLIQGLLDRIESLLSSPVIFTDVSPESHLNKTQDGSGEFGAIVRRLEIVVEKNHKQLASARSMLGINFTGTPDDWSQIETICAWAESLEAEPAFTGNVPTLINTCASQPEMATRLAADAQVAKTALEQLRVFLANSSSPLRNSDSVALSVATLRREYGSIREGIEIIRPRPAATVASMRETLALVRQFHNASDSTEQLRQTIAPEEFTTHTIETSLAWALRLESAGLPRSLVAFVAENPDQASHLHLFLERCRHHQTALDETRMAGIERVLWHDSQTTILHTKVLAKRFADTLVVARSQVPNLGVQEDCTVETLRRGLSAAYQTVSLLALAPQWTQRLGCDPFAQHEPGTAVRETICWIESLQANRMPAPVLTWALIEASDLRVHWWAELIELAKTWRALRSSIHSPSLPESTDSETLLYWRTALSATHSSLTLAGDQLSRVVRCQTLSLAQLRIGASALASAAEAGTRAQQISQKLGGTTTGITNSKTTRDHRLFAIALADLPAEICVWVLKAGSQAAVAHFRAAEALIKQSADAWDNLETKLRSFGPFEGEAAGGLLNRDKSIAEALAVAEGALNQLHGLPAWATLRREINRATTLGIRELADEVFRHKATPEQAALAFAAALACQKAQAVWKENPQFERFRSSRHEELRRDFATEDADSIRVQNRKRIVASLRERNGGGMASWGNGDADRLLLFQAGRKRKLMPVRLLIENAGERMQELCPCWFATPTAIAQFMKPGAVTFDLIIMDEASQLTPEDSWGAVARGKQVVIVGDPLQMPPSNFFGTVSTDDEDDDEIEASDTQPPTSIKEPSFTLRGYQQESVLKAAQAVLPQVWLSWHYRSLHQGLIAPANHLSYGRRLVLFPSSHVRHDHLGVHYRYVADGTTTTGSVKNVNEARDVVNHLAELAAEFAQPKHKRLKRAPRSIGIIAMNIHQQEIIKDLIDSRRQSDPAFNAHLSFLEEHPTEPLFIRNLENVQGDERDVIIISMTYGPQTPGGSPRQLFGPIGKDGGERRFNVLITRAKWKMAVFSSFRSSQLTSGQVGVKHMRTFLEYCETGRFTEAGISSNRGFDSPFEAHVHAVLVAKGYAVEQQVGVAGYFVDLAIKDPLTPSRYVLGIECDGASYHSSRAARDRDRLREAVLVDRGWCLHRIWSTEWFCNNAAARRALFAAVEDALKPDSKR